MGEVCGQETSCDGCNGLINCKWCSHHVSGLGCYPIDGADGCLIGATCENLVKCVREEAEYVGYGSPVPFIISGSIAVFCICLIALFCTTLCSVFVAKSHYHRPVTGLDEEENVESAYLELHEMHNSSNIVFEQEHEGEEEQDAGIAHRRNKWLKGSEWTENLAQIGKNLAHSGSDRFFRRICQVLTIVVIILVIVLALLSPYEPEFSVCTSSWNWGSFLDTVKKAPAEGFKLRGKYAMLVSFYNPNKFDMSLVECTGVFTYGDEQVGTFRFQNGTSSFTVPGGSINDLTITANLDMSFTKAWDIANDYRQNKLILWLSTDAIIAVMDPYGKVKYTTDFYVPKMELDMSKVSKEHCKCK